MKLRPKALACALTLCASTAAADDVHRHDFERAGDTAGWVAPDARNCSVSNAGSGGSPGGYLDVDCKAYTLVGAISTSAELPARFAGRWTVRFDVAQLGEASPGVLELVLSGRRGSWSYMRSWDDAPQSTWRTYSMTFDAGWSDGQAILNGWYPNVNSARSDGAHDGWAATLGDGARIHLYFGASPAQAPLRIGLDNFEVGTATATPAPGAEHR